MTILPILNKNEETEIRLTLKLLDTEHKTIKNKIDVVLNKQLDLKNKHNNAVQRIKQIRIILSQNIGTMQIYYENEIIGLAREIAQIKKEINEQIELDKQLVSESDKIVDMKNKYIKQINMKAYSDYINMFDELEQYINKYLVIFKDIYECAEVICKISHTLNSGINRGFFHFIDLSYFIEDYKNLLPYNNMNLNKGGIFNQKIFNEIKRKACIKYIAKYNININDVSLDYMMYMCGKNYAEKFGYDMIETQEQLDDIAIDFIEDGILFGEDPDLIQ